MTLQEFAERLRSFLAYLPADERAASQRCLQPPMSGEDMSFRIMWIVDSIVLRNPSLLEQLDRLLAEIATLPNDGGAAWVEEVRRRRRPRPTA